MLNTKRIYSTINTETGIMKWYFQAREGNIGPFSSKPEAVSGLKEFLLNVVKNGQEGNRDINSQESIAALQLQSFLKYDARS